MNIPAIIKKPSAFLPVLMSFGALLVLLGHVALSGAARESDEGAAAHVFQLLMAAQVPLIVYFAIRWFARTPRAGWPVLALQVAAALAALAPVYFLHL